VDVLGGILALAAVFFVFWLLQKGWDGLVTWVYRTVLYRSEYQEGLKILANFCFETDASVPDLIAACAAHVAGLKHAALHEASRTDDRITFKYGVAVIAPIFEVSVGFTREDSRTLGEFAFLNWKEKGGILVQQDVMKAVRKEIRAGIRAVDPNVKFVEGLWDDTETAPAGESLPVAQDPKALATDEGEFFDRV